MAIEDKPISEINEMDLLDLITNRVSERKTIDYKRDLIAKGEGARKEFLADVSSFANSAGGFLIFGMDEKGGEPITLTGLTGIDVDKEILGMEQTLRDGIRPPISGIQTHGIHLSSNSRAIIMRIPKSWNPPHQVVFQKENRFYGRDSRGKYRLEVDELRGVFAFSANSAERMRQFRVDRIAKIIAGETPLRLGVEAKMVAHFLPLAAFSGAGVAVDIARAQANPHELIGMAGGGSIFVNLDGIVAKRQRALGTRYAQLFRGGCIEVISDFSDEANARKALPGPAFEHELINEVTRAKRLYQQLGVGAPLIITLTLIGMEGWRILYSDYEASSDTFDRNPILIPELVLDSFDGYPANELKPLLDIVWNAAGFVGSPHYDREGRRT